MKTAIELIKEERERQVKKGYTPKHDDAHFIGEIADCAAAYALTKYTIDRINDALSVYYDSDAIDIIWGFNKESYKPTPNDRICQLTKAAAMLVAEIERLQRLEKTKID